MPEPLPPHRIDFPLLTDDNHQQTSCVDPSYNCIGYAAGTRYWIQPSDTIEAWIREFERRGYELCEDETFEQGMNKIAIFVKDDEASMKPEQCCRDCMSWSFCMIYGRACDRDHLEANGAKETERLQRQDGSPDERGRNDRSQAHETHGPRRLSL